ncbi:MAG TPA: Xaa-Pro aminopeptidase, partial [Longimicrobium sp.]
MPLHESAATHQRRRERFIAELGGGVAILCAGPELVSSRDTEIRYRPDSDIYYLTGFTEPGTVALFTPHDPDHRFTLFVRPRDPEREAWAGSRAGPEGAVETFGANAAYPMSELDERLKDLLEPADAVHYALGTDAAMDARLIALLTGFRSSRARNGKGPVEVRDPGTILGRMRSIKEPDELELMRAAAATAAEAHAAVIRATRPGVGEWELEAILESTFRRAGPDAGTAFAPIVGSGTNATILHYVDNTRLIADGDLV